MGKQIKRIVVASAPRPRILIRLKFNQIRISSICVRMIFSENRFPLFRIML